MTSTRKALVRGMLAAVALSTGFVTSAMAGPASGSLAPAGLTVKAANLVGDLKAQGEGALPVVQV